MENGLLITENSGSGSSRGSGADQIGEKALHTLVHTLPAYLYSVHYQNGIATTTIHSRQCEKITGYTPSDYMRDPNLWLTMIHPDDQAAAREFFNALSSIRPPNQNGVQPRCDTRGSGFSECACNDQGFILEHRIIRKDGVLRWIANRCVAVHDDKGRLLRIDGLVMDITAQKATEYQLSARLEKERQHATEMEMLKTRMEDAMHQNNRFMSLIVHDLRSPITSVITYLKLLERQCSEGDFGSVAEVSRRVRGMNEILLKQIDDLLTISRLRNGGIQMKKRFFDAFALIQRVLDNHRLQAEMKGVELNCAAEPGIRLYADFNLAHEVVGNLVSNAVKFCGRGNTVTISARLNPKPIITVANDGPNIEPKLLPNLFRFDLPTSTAGSSGERGTGLGLPLSAEMMRMQGGELRAANNVEKGCYFEAVFQDKRPVVLVVDNDEVDRFTLKGLVTLLDVEVITASSGKDALKILEEREVHLILSDIIMPEMDGCELLKALRHNGNCGGIQFIALTAFPESELCQRVLGMGTDDFIKKPVDPSDLLLRVRRLTA